MMGLVTLVAGTTAAYVSQTVQSQSATLLQHLTGDESEPLNVGSLAGIPAFAKMRLDQYVSPKEGGYLNPELLVKDFSELAEQGLKMGRKLPSMAAETMAALSGSEHTPTLDATRQELTQQHSQTHHHRH
jgi:hypothetical protein